LAAFHQPIDAKQHEIHCDTIDRESYQTNEPELLRGNGEAVMLWKSARVIDFCVQKDRDVEAWLKSESEEITNDLGLNRLIDKRNSDGFQHEEGEPNLHADSA
jgi:hypothetical protein